MSEATQEFVVLAQDSDRFYTVEADKVDQAYDLASKIGRTGVFATVSRPFNEILLARLMTSRINLEADDSDPDRAERNPQLSVREIADAIRTERGNV